MVTIRCPGGRPGWALWKWLAVAVLVSSGSGCVSAGHREPRTASGPEALTLCREPRPQACIQLYDPVCASLKNGTTRTFSNGCAACAEPAVVGHRPGTCP
jgi:hypothetical protein